MIDIAAEGANLGICLRVVELMQCLRSATHPYRSSLYTVPHVKADDRVVEALRQEGLSTLAHVRPTLGGSAQRSAIPSSFCKRPLGNASLSVGWFVCLCAVSGVRKPSPRACGDGFEGKACQRSGGLRGSPSKNADSVFAVRFAPSVAGRRLSGGRRRGQRRRGSGEL